MEDDGKKSLRNAFSKETLLLKDSLYVDKNSLEPVTTEDVPVNFETNRNEHQPIQSGDVWFVDKRIAKNYLPNEVSLNQDGNGTKSEEIRSGHSLVIGIKKTLTNMASEESLFNPGDGSSHPKKRTRSKNSLDSCRKRINLLKDVSTSPEWHQTKDLGRKKKFSAKESSSKRHLGKESSSKSHPGKETSSKSRPGKESSSKSHPGKESSSKSRPGKVSSSKSRPGKESSSNEDFSKSPLQSDLIIPKVAKRLSVKNAKRKFVSKREKTNLKAKKQRLLKNLSSDSDFLSKEWDKSDSSSEDQDQEDSDSSSAGSHECSICHRLYKNYKSLKRHLNTHSKDGKSDFQCQTCEAAFDQKADLDKHMSTHDGSRPYRCQECGSMFTQSSALKRHQRIHSNLKPFSCANCGASFTQSSSLKRHQNTHRQTKAFVCGFCQASFVEKHHLQAHVNSMHSDLPAQERRYFTCNICSATFSQKSSLWHHKKSVHERNKNYKCKKCDKSFSLKSNLNRHCNQKHTELPEDDAEKPFACSVCGDRFSRNVKLKLHLRLHDTQDLYSCHLCGKTFTYKQWLRKHMASHRSGIGYCEQCGRKFRSLFLLSVHTFKGGKCAKPNVLTSVNNRWKHVCKYCDLRYSLSSKLAKHMRKAHPKAEVFTCDVCDKGFCYHFEYVSHRKTHGNIPYQCKTCEVAFPRYGQLFQHCKNHLNPSKTSVASSPSVDPSFVSNVPADTGVFENSSKPVAESDLGKEPDTMASCSKKEPENSVRTENSSAGEALNAESSKNPGVPVQDSESLKCQICRLVFLIKLNYRKHCRLVHGEHMYQCQECDKDFDHCRLLHLHMKSSHPKPKKSKKIIKPKKSKKIIKPNKSKKIIKPKKGPKFDPARLEKLLKAKVKESMERSKRRSSGTKNKMVKLPRNYVID